MTGLNTSVNHTTLPGGSACHIVMTQIDNFKQDYGVDNMRLVNPIQDEVMNTFDNFNADDGTISMASQTDILKVKPSNTINSNHQPYINLYIISINKTPHKKHNTNKNKKRESKIIPLHSTIKPTKDSHIIVSNVIIPKSAAKFVNKYHNHKPKRPTEPILNTMINECHSNKPTVLFQSRCDSLRSPS